MRDDPRSRSKATGRRGWPWTLLKCAIVLGLFAAAGAASLWWLLHQVDAPWFIPRVVFAWLVAKVSPYAAWIGGAVGAFVGFLASLGVVIVDAKRGRLSKVR